MILVQVTSYTVEFKFNFHWKALTGFLHLGREKKTTPQLQLGSNLHPAITQGLETIMTKKKSATFEVGVSVFLSTLTD